MAELSVEDRELTTMESAERSVDNLEEIPER